MTNAEVATANVPETRSALNLTQAQSEIVKYLAAGHKAVHVAKAVGVTESYVAMFQSQPEIAELISELSAARLSKSTKHDDNIESAEETALSRVTQLLPFADLKTALNAFNTLNKAVKRKDTSTGSGAAQNGPVVSIVLPQTTINNYVQNPTFVTNSTNEIIEVEGRAMVTASVAQVTAALQATGIHPNLKSAEESENLRASELIASMQGAIFKKSKRLANVIENQESRAANIADML